MAEQRPAWEQLEGEPTEAYARFLVYRNLGPGRSLRAAQEAIGGEAATKGNKKQQVAGNWGRESVDYQWPARATAWDIENLVLHGQRTVINQQVALELYSQRLVEALANGSVIPETWNAAREAIEFLGRYIPEHAAQRLYLARADAGRDGAGASGADPAPDAAGLHRGDGEDHP